MDVIIRYATNAIVFLIVFGAFVRAVRSKNPGEPYRLVQKIGYAIIGGFAGMVVDMWVGSQASPSIATSFVGGVGGHFVYTGWRAVYYWFYPLSHLTFTIFGAFLGWYIAILFPQSMQLPKQNQDTRTTSRADSSTVTKGNSKTH